MAFVRDRNIIDDKEETTGFNDGLINPTITSAAGGVTDTAAAPQTAQTGTGFGSLQKYLQANQAGAQNLAGQVANKVQGAAQEATAAFQPAVQQFSQQVQQGTNIFNPNAKEGDTEDLTGYAGPENFAGSEQDLALQKKVYEAQQLAEAAKNPAGQAQLLKELAPGTTQGGANLNQFLVQNTQPAWNTISNAANQAAGVGDQYDAVTGQLMNKIQQAKQVSSKTREQGLALQDKLYRSRLQSEADAQKAYQQQLLAQQAAALKEQQDRQNAAQAAAQQAYAEQQARVLQQFQAQQAAQQAQLKAQANAQAKAQAQQAAAQKAEYDRQMAAQRAALSKIQQDAAAAAAAKVTTPAPAPAPAPVTPPTEKINLPSKPIPVTPPAPAPAPKPTQPTYDKASGTWGKGMEGYLVPSSQQIVGYNGDNEVYGWVDKYGNQVQAPAPTGYWQDMGDSRQDWIPYAPAPAPVAKAPEPKKTIQPVNTGSNSGTKKMALR